MKCSFEFLMFVLAACLAAGCSRTDEDRLQGTWEVISAERGGNPVSEAVGNRWVFTKNKLSITTKDGTPAEISFPAVSDAEFRLDETKSPKEMDVLLPAKTLPPELQRDFQAMTHIDKSIYMLEEDILRHCTGESFTTVNQPDRSETERPTGFATKEGDGCVLYVLKRVEN